VHTIFSLKKEELVITAAQDKSSLQRLSTGQCRYTAKQFEANAFSFQFSIGLRVQHMLHDFMLFKGHCNE
jgi:hypothetical protein